MIYNEEYISINLADSLKSAELYKLKYITNLANETFYHRGHGLHVFRETLWI